MRNDSKNIIVDLTFKFAIKVVEFCEELEENRKFVVAHQLLKSGTSIGANVREAQNAESRTDFIHKLKIAAKEADECEYWLLICNESKNYPNAASLLNDNFEIIKILSKIISTTKNKK